MDPGSACVNTFYSNPLLYLWDTFLMGHQTKWLLDSEECEDSITAWIFEIIGKFSRVK